MTVIYDPARPEEAKVALGSMFWFDTKALLVVGGIFLAAVTFFFPLFVAVIVRVWRSLSVREDARGRTPGDRLRPTGQRASRTRPECRT